MRIGLLSDMGGPYRDVGGPGNRVAVELAIEDFGGSVLGRPIEVLQGDDQNKPDVASSLARMDRQSGHRRACRWCCLFVGPRHSAGLPRGARGDTWFFITADYVRLRAGTGWVICP